MKLNNLIEYNKAILAGAAIAIGAMLYLTVGGVAGAIGFTIGLYLVLWYGLNLYTGKVGHASSWKDWLNLLFMLIGNIIGTLLVVMILPHPAAIAAITAKLTVPLWIVFLKAVVCGILIYAGVDQYKKGHRYAPIIAVPAFILCGAEHCIADFCFFVAAGAIMPTTFIPFILIVILGNSIGSLLFRFLTT